VGGKRAHSDVEVALVTALEALKCVHAAFVAAQLAVQSTVRSAQVVAMPAWTSVGSTSAGSGEADLVRAAQPFLQDFFDNRDREKSQARLLRRRWEDRPRAAGRGRLVSRRRAVLRGRW
jgi:hypothetical protein